MKTTNKIFVGSDHAGFQLKKELLSQLRETFPDLSFEDVGCLNEESVHYPDFAAKVAREVTRQKARGILICGSGIGMSIAANKIAGIRAAVVWDRQSAQLSRQHNDSNILCLGARLVPAEVAKEAARIWLTTDFEGGRHQQRVDLIKKLEQGENE